jgi:hypothetical protein
VTNSKATFCLRQLEMESVWFKNHLYLFIYCGTGVWTKGLELIMQMLYHLSQACSPFFALVIFQIRVLHFCPGLASYHQPITYASCVVGITGSCHHVQLIGWMGSY